MNGLGKGTSDVFNDLLSFIKTTTFLCYDRFVYLAIFLRNFLMIHAADAPHKAPVNAPQITSVG